jgi:hypothetical protein
MITIHDRIFIISIGIIELNIKSLEFIKAIVLILALRFKLKI